MFKSILALVPSERPVRPVIDGSVALAMACHAHVNALAIGYESTNIPMAAIAGPATGMMFEENRLRALERAQTAMSVFEVEAKNGGISCNCRAISAIPAEALSIAGAAARLHELIVALQPEFERHTFDNDLSMEILFQAGGPVLFMPYTFRGAFSARRVGVCWDGGRLASRALRDAMPLLRKADALTIITITNSSSIPAEATPERLVRHLARVGLPARIVSFPAGHSEIQPAILSVAADQSLDLLVMGGYGHSRLQERILGGVTREMLRCMTVPTLMSH
ncbi:universal stress protein [Bradyrhizobium sp. BRP22]|uniref:universal stress protein n=1 Tax=Bradyrhizobium sp. BRP22 TaxID=2793821 RepID=UPI001CD702B0|nr:universal stress protein [Bradyrhizobium sp. BRP22]MCA1456060.1 universal stress protein [Bradyrhizobium sp. BRP22]